MAELVRYGKGWWLTDEEAREEERLHLEARALHTLVEQMKTAGCSALDLDVLEAAAYKAKCAQAEFMFAHFRDEAGNLLYSKLIEEDAEGNRVETWKRTSELTSAERIRIFESWSV